MRDSVENQSRATKKQGSLQVDDEEDFAESIQMSIERMSDEGGVATELPHSKERVEAFNEPTDTTS